MADPGFDAEALADLKAFWEIYAPVRERVADAVHASQREPLAPATRLLTPAGTRRREEELFFAGARAVETGDFEAFSEALREQGRIYAVAGMPFDAWFVATEELSRLATAELVAACGGERDRLARAVHGLALYVDFMRAWIGDAYLAEQERSIERQKLAIRELSIPVLTLRDRLLLVPVVGVVDNERAQMLNDTLLRAIRERRGLVVIIDVTGVPVVDSNVAANLSQAIEAARLMGADVVVSGIGPDIAQALVAVGATVDALTVGVLQDALERADQLLGHRRVRSVDVPPDVPSIFERGRGAQQAQPRQVTRS